jgi:hypothetical protein
LLAWKVLISQVKNFGNGLADMKKGHLKYFHLLVKCQQYGAGLKINTSISLIKLCDKMFKTYIKESLKLVTRRSAV